MKVIELEKITRSDLKRLFASTLTAYNKYSLLTIDNSMQAIKTHLSQNEKKFLSFFCKVFKCTLNFKHFEKEITLIAYVFPKLRTPKDVVR